MSYYLVFEFDRLEIRDRRAPCSKSIMTMLKSRQLCPAMLLVVLRGRRIRDENDLVGF